MPLPACPTTFVGLQRVPIAQVSANLRTHLAAFNLIRVIDMACETSLYRELLSYACNEGLRMDDTLQMAADG